MPVCAMLARTRTALLALLLGLSGISFPAAYAQDDDWSITRDRPARDRPARDRPARDRPARDRPAAGGDLSARYLDIVLSDPRDGFAMDRLLALYRTPDGELTALLTALEARDDAAHHRAVELIRARVDRERGALDDAARRYREVLVASPNEVIAELGLTTLARARGDLAEAREHLRRAAEHAPASDREELFRALGELSLDLGDFDGAEAAYGALTRGARSVHLRGELPRALAARGEHARAITAYRALASEVAGDRRVHAPLLVEVARSELALHQLDAAIETLTQARDRAAPGAGVRGEIVELLLDAHRRRGTLETLVTEWASARGPEELMARARALDELGRDEDAATAYRRAGAARARDPDPRLGEIRVLLRSGRIDEAIASYRALLRIAPRPQHVIALAELLEAHGRRDEALSITDGLLRTARASDTATLDALAALFVRWGDEARATRALTRRAELSPSDPVPLVALGDQLLAAGDLEGALRTFRRILHLGGDAASLHATLGGVFLDHDRLPDALTELETALRLRREAGQEVELETLRMMAIARERSGDEARAELAWREVLTAASDPRTTSPGTAREAREHITASWARGRTLDAHLRELRLAFEADPPDLDAGRFLVEALRRRRDLAPATAVLRRLDELAPGDLANLELLERLEVQRGDLRGAIDALARLARAEPRRAAARYRRMSEHALALYQDDEALGYARRAVELAPDEADGWVRLSELLRAGGDGDGALTALRRAVELDERRFELALDLADLLTARGDRAGAETLLLGVVARSPDDALVSRAVRSTLDLHAVEDDASALLPLESALLTQVLRSPERVPLRRAFVDLLHARIAPLAARMDAEPALAGELSRTVTRGLAPLLLSIASSDPTEASAAIALVRLARARGAAGALLVRAERAGDSSARLEALSALGGLVDASHASRLIALTRSASTDSTTDAALGRASDVSLRALATWVLSRALHLDRAALERALIPLLTDPHPEVRSYAALGLGGAIHTPPSAALRTAATRALESTGPELPLMAWAFAAALPEAVAARFGTPGEAASPLLLRALARTERPTARRWLVQALLGPTRAGATDALRSAPAMTIADPHAGERASAFLLRSLGQRPVDLRPLSESLQQTLLSALLHAEGADAEQRTAALMLLVPSTLPSTAGDRSCVAIEGLSLPLDREGACLSPSVLEALDAPLAALLEPTIPEVLRARATAILAAGTRASDPELFARALADASPRVLREALQARLGAPVASGLVPILMQALSEHPDWSVRALAAGALASSPDAESALVRAAQQDEYALVRDAAVRALLTRSDLSPEARAAIALICESDPEPRVREIAAGSALCVRE
jgi:tetratricopeptide (TPR) repeat protein